MSQTVNKQTEALRYKNKKKCNPIQLVVRLSIAWMFLIIFFERIYPKYVINKCQWSNWEHWSSDVSPYRIAIFADPQIIDKYTYPKQFKVIKWLITKISDQYHHNNFKIVNETLKSDSNIFLGDLFDGGRYWDIEYWSEEFNRFNKIFPKDVKLDIRSIPGNHDIGFQNISLSKVERFAKHFGRVNKEIELGNHTIILFDAISLSNENSTIREDAEKYLSNFENYKLPRILLIHVPLYRFPDKQLCGPLREKKHKSFPLQRGDEYQTVIEWHHTQRILNTFKPTLILAGDDHDYCDITQDYEDGRAREIAVKSCAMTSGIKYPAIQLLSLYNDGINDVTYETQMCYMPTPLINVYVYAAFYIASLVYIYSKWKETPIWTILIPLSILYSIYI